MIPQEAYLAANAALKKLSDTGPGDEYRVSQFAQLCKRLETEPLGEHRDTIFKMAIIAAITIVYRYNSNTAARN